MACGVAVVASDVGGQRELVTPECGILIVKSDEATEALAYAAALGELVQDSSRCQAMGAASRRRIEEHFRLEHMGARLVAALNEALRLHRETPRLLPSHGLGLLCAAHAIEYTRLTEAADELWSERRRTDATSPEAPAPVLVANGFAHPSHAALLEWIGELEHGKAWLEEQVHNWQATAEARERQLYDLHAWSAQLEQGKAWLEEQVRAWRTVAEERERLLQTQIPWMAELERGKAWLEEQVRNWRLVAEERERLLGEQERLLDEQRRWSDELQHAKTWLDEQRQSWRAAAEHYERLSQERHAHLLQLERSLEQAEARQRRGQDELTRFRQSLWGRLGARLGLVPAAMLDPQETRDTPEALPKESET
jgi:hypothetical protein